MTLAAGHTGKEAGRISGFAKTVIIGQSLANLFLSAWLYEHYLNNVYFHSYVNTVLATPIPTTTMLSIVALFMVSGGLLAGRKDRQRKVRMGLGVQGKSGGPVITPVSLPRTVDPPRVSSPKTQAAVPKGTEIVAVTTPKTSSSQVEAGKTLESKSQ